MSLPVYFRALLLICVVLGISKAAFAQAPFEPAQCNIIHFYRLTFDLGLVKQGREFVAVKKNSLDTGVQQVWVLWKKYGGALQAGPARFCKIGDIPVRVGATRHISPRTEDDHEIMGELVSPETPNQWVVYNPKPLRRLTLDPNSWWKDIEMSHLLSLNFCESGVYPPANLRWEALRCPGEGDVQEQQQFEAAQAPLWKRVLGLRREAVPQPGLLAPQPALTPLYPSSEALRLHPPGSGLVLTDGAGGPIPSFETPTQVAVNGAIAAGAIVGFLGAFYVVEAAAAIGTACAAAPARCLKVIDVATRQVWNLIPAAGTAALGAVILTPVTAPPPGQLRLPTPGLSLPLLPGTPRPQQLRLP